MEKLQPPEIEFSWTGVGHVDRDRGAIFVTYQGGTKLPSSSVLKELEHSAKLVLPQARCLQSGGAVLATSRGGEYVANVSVPEETNCNLCSFGGLASPCTGRIATSSGGRSMASISLNVELQPAPESIVKLRGDKSRAPDRSNGTPTDSPTAKAKTQMSKPIQTATDRFGEPDTDTVSGDKGEIAEPTQASQLLEAMQALHNSDSMTPVLCAYTYPHHPVFGSPEIIKLGNEVLIQNTVGQIFRCAPEVDGDFQVTIQKGGQGVQRRFSAGACTFCPMQTTGITMDVKVYRCSGARDDQDNSNQLLAKIVADTKK